MKMKKYTAPSIAEAMKQIRAELGEDAVILNSKVVTTKKLLGLVKKKHFEVVAGVDRIESKPPQKVQVEEQVLPDNSLTEAITKHNENVQKSTPFNVQNSALAYDKQDDLKKEILDLKRMMRSLQKESEQEAYSDELLQLIEHLKKQELDNQLITDISDELFAYSKSNDNVSLQSLVQEAKQILVKKVEHLPFEGLDYSKKYVHVLGPTGVGKTTTIAKMAARSVLEKKKKIGFITTDTYRIAAIEQLKTYAGLLQAPIEIAYNAEDYENAIKKLDYLDLIFIDTAGRNYKESKYVDDLQKLIQFNEQSQAFLVLALTAKEKDLEVIIEQFTSLPISKFIFTKLDETNSIGTLFNLMIKYNKGLAYYTNGQEVPEDIEEANRDRLIEMFFQGELT